MAIKNREMLLTSVCDKHQFKYMDDNKSLSKISGCVMKVRISYANRFKSKQASVLSDQGSDAKRALLRSMWPAAGEVLALLVLNLDLQMYTNN